MRGLLALIIAVAAPHRRRPLPAADDAAPARAGQARRRLHQHHASTAGDGWDGTGARSRGRHLPRAAPPAHPAPDGRTPHARRRDARRAPRRRPRRGARHRASPPPDRLDPARQAAEGPRRARRPGRDLRAHYADAERRFGIHWTVLASINFVESAFGRVRSASESGARGPMQFMPVDLARVRRRRRHRGPARRDPRRRPLPEGLRRARGPRPALYAYNHSWATSRRVRRFAARMRADERTFRSCC